MAIYFDKNKLDRVLTSYNELTNITITIFDADLQEICSAGPWQPYCLAICEDWDRRALCYECDLCHAHEARDLRKTITYTCHAGIVEAITPVFCDNVLIAYLMMGKFRDEEQIYSSEVLVEASAEKYNLDKERMLSAYHKLPIFSQKYINNAIMHLEVLVSYIVGAEGIIKQNRPLIANHLAQYIEVHLKERLTIDDLCRHFHIARHILYEIFEKNFNTTAQKYITNKRMELAKNLLVTSDKSMRQISEETGFGEYNYFIQFFKKQTGITPLQYRKQNSQT